MPFPGTFGTALATVLGGQGQANQTSAAYAQQMQQRQLEEQLKRAQLMMQMQDASDTRAAVAKLPDDEKQYLRLGGSVDNYQKRGERTTKANSIADQLYQKSLDPNASVEERMQSAQLSANLRAHPELVDSLPESLKLTGIGDKPGRPFELVDKDTGAPIFYSGTGPVPPNAVSGQVYAANHKQSGGDKFLGSLVGETKGINAIDPETGLPWKNPSMTWKDAMAAGAVPISDNGKQALDLNEAANADLDNLLAAGKTVLPDAGASKLAKGLAPTKIGAEAFFGDADASSYNAAKIGLITHLRAVANAARVNAQELAQVNSALSNAHSYPALVAAVNQARDMLTKSRKYLVKAGTMDPASNSPSAPIPAGGSTGTPVYVGGKIVGYTTDGKTMTPVGP